MTTLSHAEGRKTPPMMPDPYIGMGPNELERYSLVRAIRAAADGDWRSAGLELEASDETAKRIGRPAKGSFLVPYDWMERRQQAPPEYRDQVKGTGSAGGYMVGTELLGASFIDRLTNAMVMGQAGVTILSGLVGDVAIPRLATGVTSYWVAENAAPTEGTQVFEQVTLSPKTNAGYVDLSRKLLTQASLDVEDMVRNDLARSLALAQDLAILQGAGTNEPTGLVNTTNVQDVSGANGDDMTLAEVIELETSVAEANGAGRLAYITNPHMRGTLKQTLITPTYGDKMVWGDGPTPLNGYPALVTAQIPKDLTKAGGSNLSYVFFGPWQDVAIGQWGSLDVLVDPYSGGTAGTVRVICFQDTDVAVRHPKAFAFGYYS